MAWNADAGIKNPNSSRSVFLSAKRVIVPPACSNPVQNTITKSITMKIAITLAHSDWLIGVWDSGICKDASLWEFDFELSKFAINFDKNISNLTGPQIRPSKGAKVTALTLMFDHTKYSSADERVKKDTSSIAKLKEFYIYLFLYYYNGIQILWDAKWNF